MIQRWLLCIRCLTPMVHNAGTVRNRSIVNRQTLAGEQRLSRVPIISANSMRHNCVREPLGLELIKRYGLAERLTKQQLRLLVSGGNQASEKGGRIDLEGEQELRSALPMLSLLGAGLPSGPIDSRLTISDAVLVCRESLPTLRTIAPELDLPSNAWSALRLVADAQNFAPDPSHKLGFALSDDAKQEDFDDNIFAGEYVIPGAVFVAEVTGVRMTGEELAAFSHGLELWQQAGGLLGGKSAHGRGRTECMVWDDVPEPELYEAAIDEKQEDALQWLDMIFATRKAKGGTSRSRPLLSE